MPYRRVILCVAICCIAGHIKPTYAQSPAATKAAPDASAPLELPCGLNAARTAHVSSVSSRATLTLSDGTNVRLSGILPARGYSAQQHLALLVLGKRVATAAVNPDTTRYGYHLAHVFILPDRHEIKSTSEAPAKSFVPVWVQEALVRQGLALAWEPAGQSNCLSRLRQAERHAQKQRAGYWTSPQAKPIPASNTRALAKLQNTFVRVGGRVIAVAFRKSNAYLNFGENWRTDFTIAVPNSLLRNHPNLKAALVALKGKSIDIQGWIQIRNGPMIVLDHPSQLGLFP